jgi:TATA-box binding protein (TBP) (component of TFIID and TFIIIB)
LRIKGTSVVVTAIGKNFLNCLSLAILSDKKINAKIFQNGTIQLTGCKRVQHAHFCVNVIYSAIQSHPEWLRMPNDSKEITYYLISVMKNVTYNLNFLINREALGEYLSNFTPYYVPPLTTGYMGVKIKIPLENPHETRIPKISWPSGEQSYTTFGEYFAHDKRKMAKKFMTSVSVFQNGKVLISGVNSDIVQSICDWTRNVVMGAREIVEIIPRPKKTFIR